MIFIAIPFLTSEKSSETDGLSINKRFFSLRFSFFFRLESTGISDRTEEFTVSKSLLSSGADALERIISSYKEVKNSESNRNETKILKFFRSLN